jgi:DNA-binding PadR family transcriptional regulator
VKNKSATPTLGELELAVLVAVLRLGAEAYGLRLGEELERRLHRTLTLSHVYATLTRLEDRGLVRSRLGDPAPQRGGRRKRIYAVQPAGKAALAAAHRAMKAMAADLESVFKGAS